MYKYIPARAGIGRCGSGTVALGVKKIKTSLLPGGADSFRSGYRLRSTHICL